MNFQAITKTSITPTLILCPYHTGTQTEIQEGISKDITSVTDKNAAQFNIESIYNHTSGDVSIILRNSGRYAFDDLSKFSLYLDGKGINNPIIVKTAFAVGDTITLNTDTKWDDIDDKVHTFKMVSPLSTQAIFTCVTSKTVNGYC